MNATWAALDSNTLAGAVQAIATVIAVVIGYGLSALSEKRTRRAMEHAADRERRLNAVIGLIDLLEEARSRAELVWKAVEPYPALDASAPATTKAKQDAALTAAVQGILPLADELRSTERQVGRQAIAIRVLGFDKSVVDSSDRAYGLVNALVAGLEGTPTELAASGDRLTRVATELGELIDGLVETGRSGT